jgi:hypothetical protein
MAHLSLFGRRLSRRQFIGGSFLAASGAGAALEGGEAVALGRQAWAIQEAWKAASQPNDRFLEDKASAFANLTLGCSFAPEQWEPDELARGEALDALKYAVQELGMREVRLGIRWSGVDHGYGRVDLSFYRPYLDYCIQNGANVCLNVGPIRTFRWPEDHVPALVLERAGAPPPGATIGAGSPLAQEAYAYLDRLLDSIAEAYSPDQLGRVTMVQPENESFFAVGAHEWKVSADYLKRVIRQIDARLPTSSLLVTSAGRLNLKAVHELFVDLIKEDARFRGRLVSGFDYHYKTPHLDEFPIIRGLDPVAFAFQFPPAKHCDANIRDARRSGYRIEVSEGQAEPFGSLKSPGNSVRDFRFMLTRCAENIVDPKAPSVIRVWGVEELTKKVLRGEATPDHEAIVELVRAINAKQPTSGLGSSQGAQLSAAARLLRAEPSQ